MPKWEYATEPTYTSLDYDLDERLKQRGRDGWELVAIHPGNSTRYIELIFKRPDTTADPGEAKLLKAIAKRKIAQKK